MPNKNYPSDVIEQARAVLEAWKEIDPALQIGDLAAAALEADLAQAGTFLSQVDALEVQLVDMRNQRDAHGEAIWDKVKRVRTGMKAIYGDDSSQYEMVGGTRMSERKPPARRTTTA